jgi:type IV pilus assembly protein PilY1
MRKLLLLVLVILMSSGLQRSYSANMTDYCYIPPTIGQQVKPNVLIVMDLSGSMQFPAYVPCNFGGYSDSVANCGTSTAASSSSWKYDTSKTYYGYFDPNKCYIYSGSSFQENSCNCSDKIGTSNCISGNLLNWITTTRVDIARWVLTGGRKNTSGTFLESEGATYTINESNLRCSFTISASTTSNRRLTISNYSGTCRISITNANIQIRPSDPSSIKGIIHSFCDTSDPNGKISEKCQLIMEFMVFAGNLRYGLIRVGKNATISNLINAINNETPYWGTPTGEALWEAYDYYKQSNDHTYESNSDYINRGNGEKDPYYDGSGGNSVPVPCRKGFVLLISDGAWNGSVDPVVPARTMATQDLRADISGKQNVYTYAVYAFGDTDPTTALQGRQAMITTAIFGGFQDNNGNTWPYPFTSYPSDSRNVVYPLPQCNPSGTWNSQCAEWDTAFNSPKDGLPYNFYEADDAPTLRSALLSALTDILRSASSGSTVATLTGRSSVSQVVVQPYFLPSYVRSDGTEVSWLGFLKAFWVDTMQNLREDTNLNKVLNLAIDTIFQLFFDTTENQTKAAMITNISTCTVSQTKSINELAPVLDGGCYLANTNPSDRNIYYNKDGVLTSLTTGEASYFTNIWKVCSNNPSVLCKNDGDCGGGESCVSADARCIIKYLRGEDAPCSDPYVQRTRTVNASDFCSALGMSGSKVWKLGDIISSSPAIAGPDPLMNYHFKYNDLSYYQYINSPQYKSRPVIAAISANDGMLHIFRIGYINQTGDPNNPIKLVNSSSNQNTDLVGKEEFAFVPKNALPYLLWYGNPNYCHVPTVDYRMMILDAKINNQWRTILVGAMGFGGEAISTSAGTFSSSVFVLDLTDWLNNNLSGQPALLWERQLPDNTLTLSFPAVAKVGGNWYVLVGSGPTNIDSNTGETYISSAKILIFSLNDGSPVRTINVSVLSATVAIGDIMPVDVDNDYTDDVAYFGVYGARSSGGVFGALYRLNLSTWTVSQAFNFGSSPTPVFGAPNYTLDENGKLWVFFGTGKYLSNADKNLSYTNYLVGFKDINWNGGGSTSLGALTDVTGQTTTITSSQTTQMCICDSSGCGLKTVVTDAQGSIPPEVPVGWYIRLNNEAIYSQPMVFGGVVDVLSAVLPQDMCAMEGSSKLYSLYYKSGTPFPRPTVLSPYAVVGNQIQQSVDIGRGVPPLGQPFQITAGSGKEFQAFLQVSTGVIVKVPQQTTSTYEGRFLLWIEK